MGAGMGEEAVEVCIPLTWDLIIGIEILALLLLAPTLLSIFWHSCTW